MLARTRVRGAVADAGLLQPPFELQHVVVELTDLVVHRLHHYLDSFVVFRIIWQDHVHGTLQPVVHAFHCIRGLPLGKGAPAADHAVRNALNAIEVLFDLRVRLSWQETFCGGQPSLHTESHNAREFLRHGILRVGFDVLLNVVLDLWQLNEDLVPSVAELRKVARILDAVRQQDRHAREEAAAQLVDASCNVWLLGHILDV
mmetsp:Transcript_22225/g.51937  ORF Transcript_22225/g.51937 Transcript_22225/m.51937 type:complete len:202 (+) Transcript_22225:145-750(+)